MNKKITGALIAIAVIVGAFLVPTLQAVPTTRYQTEIVPAQRYVPSTDTTLALTATLIPNRALMRVTASGWAKTLTATPTIDDGLDGQVVIVQGLSDTLTLTFQDEAQLANSGLDLNDDQDVTLGLYDFIMLQYDAGDDLWHELYRSETIQRQITINTPSTDTTWRTSVSLIATSSIMRVVGPSAPVSISSTPSITDGTDGQILYIEGANDTDTVTLRDATNLASTGLDLRNNQDVILGVDDYIFLIYDAGSDIWTELSRSDDFRPSVDQAITAAGGITAFHAVMQVVGAGGAVSVTATPSIADGKDGQIVRIQGTNDTNTVTLRDEDNLASTGRSLSNNRDVALGANEFIVLMYDAGGDLWIEINRSAMWQSIGETYYTPSTDFTIRNTPALQPTQSYIRVVGNYAGAPGAVIVTSTPSIADGSDGERLLIQGTSDTNTVTYQDESNLGNSGLQLAGGADITLGVGDTIELIYDAGDDNWYEISRSNN
jgi:hypothetical protein